MKAQDSSDPIDIQFVIFEDAYIQYADTLCIFKTQEEALTLMELGKTSDMELLRTFADDVDNKNFNRETWPHAKIPYADYVYKRVGRNPKYNLVMGIRWSGSYCVGLTYLYGLSPGESSQTIRDEYGDNPQKLRKYIDDCLLLFDQTDKLPMWSWKDAYPEHTPPNSMWVKYR